MPDFTLRTRMLLGERADRLKDKHVAVFGLGGVGSFAAEALVRSGVGRLTLVDHDEVGATNLNRQLIALRSTIGRPKCTVMAERALDINPDIQVRALQMRYAADTRDTFFDRRYDYILDAIDLVACKLDLIGTAIEKEIPIISALGTGNKLDPSGLKITDIAKTSTCPFARVMRKELRKRGILHLDVLYSTEPAMESEQVEEPPPGRRSVPGSVPWVPGSAGLMMAGHVVLGLLKDDPGA